MTAQQRLRHQAGFTLVELLVVIAIIALLVGLLAAAVMRAFTKSEDAQCRARTPRAFAGARPLRGANVSLTRQARCAGLCHRRIPSFVGLRG